MDMDVTAITQSVLISLYHCVSLYGQPQALSSVDTIRMHGPGMGQYRIRYLPHLGYGYTEWALCVLHVGYLSYIIKTIASWWFTEVGVSFYLQYFIVLIFQFPILVFALLSVSPTLC